MVSLVAGLTNSLRVSVSIPELVKLNDAFWLNCSHQRMETRSQQQQQQDGQAEAPRRQEDIYAVKWYKDDEEFYRFLPNAKPKVSIYETNGIQLDQAKSHEGNVFLTKADVNTEGNYRCEILSEAPSFETVRKSKHLKVYALPIRGPRIEILDSNGRAKSPKTQEISYAVGDKIELRCNSAPSKPAARIRWYINDHELMVPNSNVSSTNSSSATEERQRRTLGYDVRITPVEYRQHYKSIYSSHSMLSLVLQQDDLINNKISFKCLASMRQDIPIKSKQLIVLMPQAAPFTGDRADQNAAYRDRRGFSDLLTAAFGASDTQPQRQRPQHHRHTISRLSQTLSRVQPEQKSLSTNIINNLTDNSKMTMMYIYEDSDSTLGSSITDRLDYLESYLQSKWLNESENTIHHAMANNYALEFNRADNLEYIQLLRERLARQRSFPSHQQSGNNIKRLHGSNFPAKSPLYLDENDSLRPIISWPPLESGKLMLLPSRQTIVAIPTPSSDTRRSSLNDQEVIFPQFLEHTSLTEPYRSRMAPDSDISIRKLMLERLLSSLNCTCMDGSIDAKIGWLVNDIILDTRDTRYYPTRVSPDHRQTWLTIAFQSPVSQEASSRFNLGTSGSLQSILASYYKDSEFVMLHANKTDTSEISNSKQLDSSDQLKIACQAIHSMFLYSSSEMITFDFNPIQKQSVDGKNIDKLTPLSSNVIQASSASQSSSAQVRTGIFISHRSQPIAQRIISHVTCIMFILITFKPPSNYF